MKHLLLALTVFASALVVARAQEAQDNQEERQQPPVEIPDFSNLDQYIYVPKSTVTLSFRHLGGAKAQFSGSGFIPSPEDPGSDPTLANIARTYHDGTASPDQRTAPRYDTSGNPIIDPQTGVTIYAPIAPDGKTNSWSYDDASQVNTYGFIAMHSYSAEVVDSVVHHQRSRSTNGLDIAVSHDMGNLFKSRATWKLVAGMSVNDISAKATATVAANLTTITDLYSLYGVNAPTAPYTSSNDSSTSQVITNPDGTTQSVVVDNGILISNKPDYRQTTTENGNLTDVTDNWKVKGAYYTFRAGPEVWFPIGSHFKIEISAGAALVYAGTSYTVVQTYTPADGSDIAITETDNAYKLRPGYYADATMQYDLTDKAGFFAGAVFQSAGSYMQQLDSATAHYATKIDLSNQSGLRAGMSVRF